MISAKIEQISFCGRLSGALPAHLGLVAVVARLGMLPTLSEALQEELYPEGSGLPPK